MLKYILAGALSMAAVGLLTGCGSVVASKTEKNVDYVVNFTGQDFNIGNVINVEAPIKPKVDNEALLLSKALSECKCDVILMPRYEVISKTFGKDVMRLTGRAASFKTSR